MCSLIVCSISLYCYVRIKRVYYYYYNQLYDHFIKNNLLSEQQYGFRANHSTELAAMRLVDHINHEMDKTTPPVISILIYPKLLTP